MRRLQERVVPALEALLSAALERDALLAEVVETSSLRRADVVKTAVLRAVSHDLCSPLTAISAAGEAVAARTVRRGSQPIHLTPIEFDLLRVLARNRGRLMTHRALLTEVWGPGYADDVQALRTHIARLRAKIEPGEGHSPRYIVTDPGVGYRFAG